MKKIFVSVLVLLLVALLALFFRQSGINQTEKIKVGYLPIGAALPLFVAEENGHFSSRGLEVEFIEFKNSNDIAAAAISKRIDFVGSGATNAMLDANSETVAGLVLFSVNNYMKRENLGSTDFVLVKKNSGFTDFSDLRGKTVAIFPGSVGEVFANAIMPKLGLERNEVDAIPMAPTQWMASLNNGSVDAVIGAIEPFATMMIKSGNFEVLHDGFYGELNDKVPASGAWFIKGRLSEEVESAIVASFADAIADIRTDPSNSKMALTKYTAISENLVTDIRLQDWEIITEPGVKESAIELAEIFYKLGGIQQLPTDDAWLWKAP